LVGEIVGREYMLQSEYVRAFAPLDGYVAVGAEVVGTRW
jgi:hypothetical protein